MLQRTMNIVHKKSVWISVVALLNLLLALLIMVDGKLRFSFLSDGAMNLLGKVEVGGEPAIATGAFTTSGSSVNGAKQYSVFTQWKLADQYQDGTYLVEAYRQYEIYKDKNGKTVKTVPTENFNYIRYCPGCEVKGLPAE
ncbi:MULTISPECIES: hypothetical protein [Paenibacillus]|uniref:hypothetical protein n=1 Tax=Paenibacillus TaxID=44249 RepID=UPI00209FFA92|nr:hypothetical protein [Paenibacillus tyrfis]MCP1310614.1 hypothetical protein [Paenibacillus tyrfis]GMX63281.1 hypothetical protein Elgi_29970 [Paenibacillus elgii]